MTKFYNYLKTPRQFWKCDKRWINCAVAAFSSYNDLYEEYDENNQLVVEIFMHPINVKITTQSATEFITEFQVEDILYTFEATIVSSTKLIHIAFYADEDYDATNLGGNKVLGLLGSGIFKSLDLCFTKYPDVEKLTFSTPLKINAIRDDELKKIDNPLVKFYDNKHTQTLLTTRFSLKALTPTITPVMGEPFKVWNYLIER